MLEYETTGKVGASAARIVAREARAIQRPWWRQALGFDVGDVQQPLILSGRTELFHKQGVPDVDDLFMAFADTVFILERLRDWAARFKLKWHLRMNKEEWGTIDPTGYSKPLLNQMDKWAAKVGLPACARGTWKIPEEKRAALAARYAGRRP